MIDRVRRHFGRLDALVNNAAIWSPTPLETVAADDVRRFFEVNALSTFVCCQHAGLIMAEQEQGGAIVNIGDWAVARPYRDYSAYFMSKATIPTMTRMFAVELAPKVRVNAVLPGPVLLPDRRLGSGTPPGNRRARLLAVPAGRKTWPRPLRSCWKTISSRVFACRSMVVARSARPAESSGKFAGRSGHARPL